MVKLIRKTFFFAFLFLTFANFANVEAQDRVTVNREIRFQRGKISAVVSNRIERGTTHVYRVGARAGQQMAVVLKTGNRTSFTVSNQYAGVLEGADGVRQTVVELPETGEYEIQIGTDANAAYTLEVAIK